MKGKGWILWDLSDGLRVQERGKKVDNSSEYDQDGREKPTNWDVDERE